MNKEKILKYLKLAGLFVLNCFNMFFGSEEDREYLVEATRKVAATAA